MFLGRKGSPKRRIFSCNSSVHSFYIQNPKSFATRPREKDANAKFFSLYDLSEIRRGTDPDPYNISTGARQFTGTPVLRRTAKPADLELCLSFVCATRYEP